MADSEVLGTPGDTGVQRALGERRRRRAVERTGAVDLGATMSHWPVTEPPTAPRPVVRPARPTLEGVATAPVLPTPGAMVVVPLLEARSATAPRARAAGSRRSPPEGAAAQREVGLGGVRSRLAGYRWLLLVAAGLVLLLVVALVAVLRPHQESGEDVGALQISHENQLGTTPSGEAP